jgi:chromosome segregation protein
MYLRALRLRGFKSFPTRTELLFEPGVAVVIGPNGSGKSNLADAVQWALGEQSPSEVRGSSMQDVIFAGSDGRRASAGAEVELVFDNEDGALPLPTREVSVLRRVGRDGGSDYFINQTSCRLTDVVEMMAGVGLGKELHSIIGQGKVESFLAGKPEDRRGQIEEAAGLGVFKRRRERAELKLREVRRNLERAEMLEREVSAQLAPLRRQASAAEQHRAVAAEMDGVKGRLLSGELAAVEAALGEQRAAEADLDERRRAVEGELEKLAVQRGVEEEAFARRLAERERRTRRLLRVRGLDGRLEAVERLVAQRLRLLDEVERAGRSEQGRLFAELEAGGDAADVELRREEEERLAKAVEGAQRRRDESGAALQSAQAEAARLRSTLAVVQLEREHALAGVARLEHRREAVSAERDRLGRQAAALGVELESRRAELGGAVDDARRARAAASEAASTARAAGTASDERQRELEAADVRRRDAERERAAVEAEIEHLRAALRDLQEVDERVLAVAGEYPGAAGLAGLLACEPGYERALAAALSQVSGALAVPETVDAWDLLAALKHAGVGLVRLILPSANGRRGGAFPGAAPLLERVSVAPDAELAGTLGDRGLAAVLGDVVIVDDLRSVPSSFPGLAVTRDGEFFRPSSGQLGLASGVPVALLLERRAALDALTARLDAVRARELREEAGLDRAREQARQSRAAADEAAASERRLRIAAEAVERDLIALRARVVDLEEGVARADRGAEALAAELAAAEAEIERLGSTAAAGLLQARELEPALTTAEEVAGRAAAVHEAELAAALRARLELEERRRARERAEDERARASARAEESRRRLAELERRLAVVPAVRAACEGLALRLHAVRSHAHDLTVRLDVDDAPTGVPDRGGLQRLAEREVEERRRLQETAVERTEVEVALARLEDRRADLGERLEEVAAALEQASFSPPSDEAEATALRETLARLERRREHIGPVNPLAEAECAELSERAAFMREQRRDLERSLDELRGLIRELTGEIDAEFAQTFAAVQAQFSHMVELLFPGGRGRLVLVDGETANATTAAPDGHAATAPGEDPAPTAPGEDPAPASPGVAVEVKPAKKLGKRLQLLSGGERALVAIAFLMALVLARPCPFYVLDEIEAALDDVNIGRLVGLLREYRERTQFIIITHQKRTMEAADVLYGVTMGPDGASQVVSARMAEEAIEREKLAEAAAPGATIDETTDSEG